MVITVQTLYWWRNLRDLKCVEEKESMQGISSVSLAVRELRHNFSVCNTIHESGKANSLGEK